MRIKSLEILNPSQSINLNIQSEHPKKKKKNQTHLQNSHFPKNNQKMFNFKTKQKNRKRYYIHFFCIFKTKLIPPKLAPTRIKPETLRVAYSNVPSQHHQTNPSGLLYYLLC